MSFPFYETEKRNPGLFLQCLFGSLDDQSGISHIKDKGEKMDIQDFNPEEEVEKTTNAFFFRKDMLKKGPQQFKIIKPVKIPNNFKDNRLENGLLIETTDDYGTQYNLRVNNKNWNILIDHFGSKVTRWAGKIVQLSVVPGEYEIDGKRVFGYELQLMPME